MIDTTNKIFRISCGAEFALKIGVFDFMQRHENRSAADLKQCMPVRKFVRLEPAPTPRHCHVWHQSTARVFREQPAPSAGSVSPEQLWERRWRHSCFTIGQIHHMTTMMCVSNIFNSNTATNLILLGKYHIHVKKWTKAKPNFEHFIKEIKQYGTSLDKIKNKKARKTYEAFCYFKLL